MPASHYLPIVGVGASAGGVEALEGFFRGMPNNPGIAIVVVTHLNPERESILHEIITRFTNLTVQVALDRAQIEANCVYVLPANAILSIENGRLTIRHPKAAQRERKPIDIFFASLAKEVGEHSAGVILSGADADGTLGIKAIKERGGLTMAQIEDGFGPHHRDMPQSAISTGFVDFAIAADEMGVKLVEFARGLKELDGTGLKAAGSEGEALEVARNEICTILRNQVGHDFVGYKPKTFLRRVQRRMQVTQLSTVEAYLARLRLDPSEVAALFRDLLINVTNFFRDAGAFESLANLVIPRLFEGRGAEDAVRVWVPGCATGEEVYSIAVLLREHMDTIACLPRVQVFATDIDERALHVARTARYPEQLLDSVSPERRRRFFVPDGGTYVLAKEVRELCIFSPHSVLRDPPFSRLDLISCRNLLIYFASDAQRQVMPTFHYSLKPGGYMFLGMSENVSQFADLFQALDKKHRIFRARMDAAADFRLPAAVTSLRASIALNDAKPRPNGGGGGLALRHTIEAHVLDRFSPAHVVANRDGDVVYYSGRTGKYLEPAQGMPTRQLVNLARKGLRLDLRTGFREAVETGRTVVRENVAIEGDDGRVQMVTLTVDPLAERHGDEPLFLILFEDEGPSLSREEAQNRVSLVQDGAAIALERELRDTRERLQSLIEEYETALEELKSSNEELVSLNEELQSTNEELEASKEELQSVNEELHTVNSELSSKVDALDHANSDLQNLFDATEIATVFLDAKLVIRSFTPAVTKVFNILPGDRGRPITDLASRLVLPRLAEDVETVIADGDLIERRIEAVGGQHFLVHIAAYRNSDRQIDGAVLTFVDITPHVEAEQRQGVMVAELQHRTRNLLGVVQSIADQTLTHDTDGLAAFNDRLRAIGRVQGLLSRAEDHPITIGALIHMELDALGASDMQDRMTLEGPEVILRKAIVQTLALGIHELATNARKYGALATPKGRLSVTWRKYTKNGDAGVKLDWHEQGLDLDREKQSSPTNGGYGRQLIEHALPYTLGAATTYEVGKKSVRCTIDMPLGRPAENSGDP